MSISWFTVQKSENCVSLAIVNHDEPYLELQPYALPFPKIVVFGARIDAWDLTQRMLHYGLRNVFQVHTILFWGDISVRVH